MDYGRTSSPRAAPGAIESVGQGLDRSADFQSAVSPIFNRQAFG
jgi:hypothetical protein